MLGEGDTLGGRYRLVSRLGAGAMSEVWAAEDEELGRRVAVKLLAPSADAERFAREARAYATCSHANVACVFDFGELEDRPYIVLEYLSGGTLEDRLESEKRLSDADTSRIADEIASGMAHAHAHGLVHRDLKPANILFDENGRAKVADFGIAQARDASTLTEAGTILGTAAYAAPEQATEEPVTPASDVYSFGVILFRMLTGQLPFTAESAIELLRLHGHAEPPAVSRVRPDAPPRLAALATAALAKDPRARPSDGGAVLRALRGEAEPTDSTSPTLVLARAPQRRKRAALGGAIALSVLVPVGFAAAVLAGGPSSSDPTPAPAPTQGDERNPPASRPQPPSSRTSSTQEKATQTTSPQRPTVTTSAPSPTQPAPEPPPAPTVTIDPTLSVPTTTPTIPTTPTP